jgi:hypothetical protein
MFEYDCLPFQLNKLLFAHGLADRNERFNKQRYESQRRTMRESDDYTLSVFLTQRCEFHR